jgi:hypothetical protein
VIGEKMTRECLILFAVTLFFIGACGQNIKSNLDDPSQNKIDEVQQAVNYKVTFSGLWLEKDHPHKFPASAHFSPLIGVVHNQELNLWKAGDLATAGIKQMAETGQTGILKQEINSHVENETALSLIEGKGIGSTGETSTVIMVSKKYSFITLSSMIAPSPDWFVGISNINLLKNGTFIKKLIFDLTKVYDSGTDSGETFTANDLPSDPPAPISQLIDEHFTNESPAIARITIEIVNP